MTKDKSLHLTPKQLGLKDNPMIHDADPLASDAGETTAAEDMLQELKDILSWALEGKVPLRAQEIAHIRSVIAKAERGSGR